MCGDWGANSQPSFSLLVPRLKPTQPEAFLTDHPKRHRGALLVRSYQIKQKNNNNGELIPYFKDVDNPEFCPVHAALRIVHRAIRLNVPAEDPLAVFHSTKGVYKGKRCYVTAKLTATFLRNLAQKVFKLKPDEPSLSRWSAHSIRVTAANLLHRQGFTDTYIQMRFLTPEKQHIPF